jgi:hypothetical protein
MDPLLGLGHGAIGHLFFPVAFEFLGEWREFGYVVLENFAIIVHVQNIAKLFPIGSLIRSFA